MRHTTPVALVFALAGLCGCYRAPTDHFDDPPGGSTGTTGSPAIASSSDGGCRRAMGSLSFQQAFVQHGDAPQLHLESITLEAWAQLRDLDASTYHTVIAKPYTAGGGDTCDSWALWYEKGALRGGAGPCDAFAGVAAYAWTPSPTAWHHLAFTFDAAQVEALYVDGTEVARQQQAGPIAYDANPVILGADRDHDAWSGFLGGELADVRIWSVVRTPQEIQSDMRSCVTGQEPGLVAAWLLDDGAHQLARDRGPFALTGVLGVDSSDTIHDPAWSTAAPP